MAQALQPAHQPVPGSVGVQLVEVIGTDLSMLGAIPQDTKSDHQQRMRGATILRKAELVIL